MLARDATEHRVTCVQRQWQQARENLGVEEGAGMGFGSHSVQSFLISLSYSEWWPIHTHEMESSSTNPNAR